MKKKVLVTGAAGYIGSVLIRKLLNMGFCVRGLDILNFGGDSLLSIFNHPDFEFVHGDIRKEKDILKSIYDVWGIVHLASIVGDPACSKQPELAEETNWIASKTLFECASKNLNVKRFIFASTCSNYGKMNGAGFVNEESPLSPVSLYAELKVKFENYLLKSQTRTDFVPTALRFSTVYGLSPRMRFDLTVNEFIRDAFIKKELEIFGEQFWRPYCHVQDLAAACIIVLESEEQKVNHRVFNVGDSGENYQKKMIADEILKLLPQTRVKYIPRNEDPRDYRVDFTRINSELGYHITKKLPDGLKEILSAIDQRIISDPYSGIYKNI